MFGEIQKQLYVFDLVHQREGSQLQVETTCLNTYLASFLLTLDKERSHSHSRDIRTSSTIAYMSATTSHLKILNTRMGQIMKNDAAN